MTCLIGDDEWCQTFKDTGYECCVRCRTHHRHPETCAGVTEDGDVPDVPTTEHGLPTPIKLPHDPEPPRDPDWAGVYARIYPIKTGWTVRIDLPESDRGKETSFFFMVNPVQVERTMLGWPPLLDGFVRAIDSWVKAR